MANVIDVEVQNLLASFCCVFEKDTLRYFSLFGLLATHVSFLHISKYKTSIGQQFVVTSDNRSEYNCLTVALCISASDAFLRVRRMNIEMEKGELFEFNDMISLKYN